MAWITLMFAMSGFSGADAKSQRWDFEDQTVGKPPSGWTSAKTGEGTGSVWKIAEDASAPKGAKVLAQTAESPRAMFNLCVADETSFLEVDVSVVFKAVAGKVDQGGGIVWRYQDPNNYYIARMNPLESNLRVYKVVDGKRIQLATKEDLTVKAGEWHTLRIEHDKRKQEIECYLDGKKLLSVDRETTIDKPGKIGLWTKADAVTYFDDLRVSGE